nr:transposase [Rhodopirellula sp. JC740]
MAFTNLRVHFVWSTKDRKPWIREPLREDLYAYIGGILRKRNHSLLAAGALKITFISWSQCINHNQLPIASVT